MMNGIFGFSQPSIPCGPEVFSLGGGLIPGAARGGEIPSLGPTTSVIESGGGAATPVAEDFATFLQGILGG